MAPDGWCWLAGWLLLQLAGCWLAAGWLAGWLGWLGGAGLAGLPGQGRAGWLVGWPAGWLAAWLPGCLADRLSLPQPRWSGAARPPRAPRPPRWSRLPIGSETSSKKNENKMFLFDLDFFFDFGTPPGDPQIEKKSIFFWAQNRPQKKCFFFRFGGPRGGPFGGPQIEKKKHFLGEPKTDPKKVKKAL